MNPRNEVVSSSYFAGSYRERSCPSVVGVVAIRRVLHLLVRGDDVFDRPVVEAVLLPVPYVARSCSHRDGGVDGRTAAERLAARGGDLRGGSSTAGREAPVVLRVARHVRGVPEVVRIAVHAVGRACLEQQHRAGRIFAETAGEDGARRASSHDDYVGAPARPLPISDIDLPPPRACGAIVAKLRGDRIREVLSPRPEGAAQSCW